MRKAPKISSKAANLPYPSSRKSKLQEQSPRPSHQASLHKERKTQPRHKPVGCLLGTVLFCRVLNFYMRGAPSSWPNRTARQNRKATYRNQKARQKVADKQSGCGKTGIINFKRRFKMDALLKREKTNIKTICNN